ncbi:hypothetical protein T439DRAFT_326950 [Meredithblackwellia eburnea MCA 4105]
MSPIEYSMAKGRFDSVKDELQRYHISDLEVYRGHDNKLLGDALETVLTTALKKCHAEWPDVHVNTLQGLIVEYGFYTFHLERLVYREQFRTDHILFVAPARYLFDWAMILRNGNVVLKRQIKDYFDWLLVEKYPSKLYQQSLRERIKSLARQNPDAFQDRLKIIRKSGYSPDWVDWKDFRFKFEDLFRFRVPDSQNEVATREERERSLEVLRGLDIIATLPDLLRLEERVVKNCPRPIPDDPPQ